MPGEEKGTILLSTANGVGEILQKKMGVQTGFYPSEWRDNINLLGKLEEKTVSGSIVAFSDGADDVPLKSCAVTIPPNLDGVSSVDVVSAGKNIVDFSEHINASSGGFTFSKVANGGISFSTASAGTWAYVTSEFDFFIPKNTTITFSRDTAFNFRHYVRLTYKDGTTQNVYINADATSATITTSEEVNAIRLYMSQLTQGESYSGIVYLMIEVGSTATTYVPFVEPTTHTANIGRTIYGGTVDVVNGTGTDENGNDFTFTPVPILSRLGDNTMWGDGDLEVVYRSSGTQTVIPPMLISKMITANGVYSAEDDGVDGYDEVTVNVPQGAQNIETVLSDNPLIEITGVGGTDITRTMWIYTSSVDGKITFHAGTKVRTNTGSNDGFFTVKKNDVVVVSTYANTSTTTAFSIPDIDIEIGDVVTIECGFDNNHSGCWFDLYSTITIVS